jgi:hypothetical protein
MEYAGIVLCVLLLLLAILSTYYSLRLGWWAARGLVLAINGTPGVPEF